MPESQFFTGKGDDGYTGLLGPERVPKNNPRPEAFGAVDEAQAVLGVARASGCSVATAQLVLAVQQDLYFLMAELAASASSPFVNSISVDHVEKLETWLAQAEAKVELPKDFLVPGDSQAGAALHLARTVVRRAERRVVSLLQEGMLENRQVVRYLNRLSSLLFVLAYVEDLIATGSAATAKRDQTTA